MILAWRGDALSHGQAQNGVNFHFEVKFDLEGQGQSPLKTIGTLTKVFYTYGPDLVILARTGDELSRGQACGYRTHRRTHRQTDAGNDNTRRPKLASGKNYFYDNILIHWSLVEYFHSFAMWCCSPGSDMHRSTAEGNHNPVPWLYICKLDMGKEQNKLPCKDHDGTLPIFTVTSLVCPGISHHQNLECLTNRLLEAIHKRQNYTLSTLCNWWSPHTKGHECGKCFHVMMSLWTTFSEQWTGLNASLTL